MVAVQEQQETRSFEAEVQQLLQIVAHSLYSDKEIFLRELISNSSDAADKLRYQAVSDDALYEGDGDLKIWVNFNKDAGTVSIRDNGIGMDREEVIKNLGMIAQSGTRAFKQLVESKKEGGDSQLIGQFGVGFYSSFVVADKVVVKTRKAGMKADEGVEWESDGQGKYTIKNIKRSQRGTEVTLYMKDDAKEFLDDSRLRTVIRKYSDHILLPIVMPKVDPEADKKREKGEIVVPEDEVVNSAKALWTLPKSEIKPEDYNEFYKQIAHDFEDPLAYSLNRVEGQNEYTSMLFIPKRAPFDLYNRDQQRGLKLYVKRIFIMDDAEHFMPLYLRFVKGIVDSSDLPLNVSREILQSNKTIDRIKTGCVKRVLGMLESMAENEKDKYAEFWKEFGQVLKEGPVEDFANKDRIANLLRFNSTHTDSDTQEVTLKDYVSRMKENQKKIYFVVADTYEAAKHSPLLEVFKKKDIEVLLMNDRIDEWLTSHLNEFDGKQLQSVAQGALDLDDLDDKETKKQQKKDEKDFKDVTKSVKKVLADKVKDVRITHRLTDSPSCVVFDEQDATGHMQRLLKATGQELPESKPILELNPTHALVVKMKAEIGNDDSLKDWSELLLGQALLAEGEQLKNPAGFVKDMNALLMKLV